MAISLDFGIQMYIIWFILANIINYIQVKKYKLGFAEIAVGTFISMIPPISIIYMMFLIYIKNKKTALS